MLVVLRIVCQTVIKQGYILYAHTDTNVLLLNRSSKHHIQPDTCNGCVHVCQRLSVDLSQCVCDPAPTHDST